MYWLDDKEANELVNTEKYECSSDRQGYRSGQYKWNLHATAGEVELKVPQLKGIPFKTTIIEKYCPWKKLLLECIWPVFLYAVLRISPKLYGEQKYLLKPSAT